MSESLEAIPDGSDVIVDANIFIYGLSAQSAPCNAFLGRCSREEITGVKLFEVVHESTHVFMLGEAKQKGFIVGQEKPARYLAKNPERVKILSDYWVNTARLLSLNLLLLPMETEIVETAQAERVAAGLLTNDSLIVATMREYGISRIATNDHLFETVAGISVFSPTDVGTAPQNT